MCKRIHRIVSETPYQKLWDTFVYFESEPLTKKFLKMRYAEDHPANAAKYALQNTYKFTYYIKQAREYYSSASHSSILIKPLLLYYGMISLLKAVVLMKDPSYPAHTRVLQHGVTSRKLKKSNYSFHEDEVKLQKEGLLPFVMQLFKVKNAKDKYQIKELLSLIPELSESYKQLYHEEVLIPVHLSDHIDYRAPVTTLYLPESVLDRTHLTYPRFIDYLNRFNVGGAMFKENPVPAPAGIIRIDWHHPQSLHVREEPEGFLNQLFIQDTKGQFYFYGKKGEPLNLPEVCIHYMLMYVLGMLARYETELWGEIVFSFQSEDMYIINDFLGVSMRKFPNLILNMLHQDVFIFETI